MDDGRELYEWVARRHPDPRPVEERVRANRRRWVLLAFALTLPLTAAMVWGVIVTAGADEDVPVWRSVVGLVLILAGLAVTSVGLVRWARSSDRPGSLGNGCRALWALTGAQRRALLRQVIGAAPTVAQDLPATRATARAYIGQAANLFFLPGAALSLAGAALQNGSSVSAVVAVLSSASAVFAVVVLPGRIEKARRFLSDHPAS